MPAGWDTETLEFYATRFNRITCLFNESLYGYAHLIYDEMTGLVWC